MPPSSPAQALEPVDVFFSYSHQDEKLRDKLATHLSLLQQQGVIKAWYDRQILPGSEWAEAIDQNMNAAQVILLLISAEFLASTYCYGIELKRAMERHEAGEACVIPVILKPVDWSGASFGKLQALPKNAKPVTTWSNRDTAFADVAKGIRQAVERFASRVTVTTTSTGIDLENPDGSVSLDSPLYIDRPPVEANCYAAILRPGTLIRIKAPRQMGKTSLMQRVLHEAEERRQRPVYLSLQQVDEEFLSNSDQFLQWFCASVANELNLDDRLDEYWKGVLGSKNKCSNYFQRYLLPAVKQPLTLGLDEVDQVFHREKLAQEFFGLLRTWHERGKNEAVWKQLRLVIAHSKEVYIPLNINHSPFNVGLPIELPELTPPQIAELVQRHGLNWSDPQLQSLIEMVDGHPYLLRKALYEIAKGQLSLEQFLQIAPTEEGLYGDHLTRHLDNMEREDPSLKDSMAQVVAKNEPVRLELQQAFKLRSMGLVKLQRNDVIPLCNLYRLYFRDRLGV